MSITEFLREWWAAFERAVDTDDWAPLKQYYHPQATYQVFGLPTPSVLQGPDNIVAGFEKSVNNFDRKFDTRKHMIVGTLPMFDDVVHYFTRVEYRKTGYPPLDTFTRSELILRDGKIFSNVNYWDHAVIETQEALAWFGKFYEELGLDPSYC